MCFRALLGTGEPFWEHSKCHHVDECLPPLWNKKSPEKSVITLFGILKGGLSLQNFQEKLSNKELFTMPKQ